MLAAIPAIAVVVSLYGLIANPADVEGASIALEALLPPGAVQMLNGQLERNVQSQEHGSASVLGSIGWFLMLLWSANRGMKSFPYYREPLAPIRCGHYRINRLSSQRGVQQVANRPNPIRLVNARDIVHRRAREKIHQ